MPLFNPNIEVDALTKMNAELLLNKYKFVYNDEHGVYLMYLKDTESKHHFYKADANLPLTITPASPDDLITYGSR
jgi:hypothetical protein